MPQPAQSQHLPGTRSRPIKAVLDPYNPVGSTAHVNFNTSKTDRWETSAQHCHVNWVILDSDWEAEFCRVAEKHPRVKAYVKNHSLGLEVPYRYLIPSLNAIIARNLFGSTGLVSRW